MAQEKTLQDYFDALISRVAGLDAIFVTDRDGVSLLKSQHPSELRSLTTQDLLVQSYSLAVEQISKMDMGRNKSVVSFAGDRIIVHVNATPLVVAFLGRTNMNVGMIQGLVDEILATLQDLRQRQSSA